MVRRKDTTVNMFTLSRSLNISKNELSRYLSSCLNTDKSHKEIAQLLGINEKSSASQLFRAKTVLARKVKEWLMMNDR